MNETMMPYEETIDLKDLCVYVLRKWKAILIAVAVGALALGAYKATTAPYETTDAAQVQANAALITEKQELLTSNATDISLLTKEIQPARSVVDSITGMEKEIEAQKAAIENMNRLIAGYETLREEAENLLENETAQESRIALLSNIATYDMTIVEISNQIVTAERKITLLEEEMAEAKEDLKISEEALESLEAQKKALEEENLELEKEIAELQKVEPDTVLVSVGMTDIIKFAVLGAVAGGVVVCGIAFLQYFMDKKLRRVDELKERYGLRILGDFYVPAEKKNKIDQMLDRLDGYSSKVDVEKEAALAAAKVQVLCPAEGGRQQIFVTGTAGQELVAQICQSLQKNVPAGQYEICALANPVYDAEALLQIRQGIVVLVEARGISEKKEIASLVDILQAGKARVLGIVLQ